MKGGCWRVLGVTVLSWGEAGQKCRQQRLDDKSDRRDHHSDNVETRQEGRTDRSQNRNEQQALSSYFRNYGTGETPGETIGAAAIGAIPAIGGAAVGLATGGATQFAGGIAAGMADAMGLGGSAPPPGPFGVDPQTLLLAGGALAVGLALASSGGK